MFARTLLSFVLLATGTSALGAAVLEVKRDSLCPNGTYPIAPSLELVKYVPHPSDPVTSYGLLSIEDAVAIATPSYGIVGEGEPLRDIVACQERITGFITVTASNAQTDPGSAIGLVAPFAPNGGYPQLGKGSPNWAYLAPTTYTPRDALPEQGYPPNPDSWFESTTWIKRCEGQGPYVRCYLDPLWTNPDGSQLVLDLAMIKGSSLFATGDFDQFVSHYSYVGKFVHARILVSQKNP